MTSPGNKIGQILKMIYLRQYLSYSFDQKLKMSEMLMAIFLVYSTSGITSGKKNYRAQNGGHLENFEILNTASFWPQIWKDRPKLWLIFFYGDDVIDERLAPGANCKVSVSSINAKRRSQWITLFEIAGQRSTSQAYCVTLALISNIANYLKYNYFLDCDGIDNVTLRKISDFCSRHTVGVAGDDIMFNILVVWTVVFRVVFYWVMSCCQHSGFYFTTRAKTWLNHTSCNMKIRAGRLHF